MNRSSSWLPLIFVSLTVLVFAAFFGWRYYQASQDSAPAETPVAAAPAPAPEPAAIEPSPADANAPPPGIANPVEEIEAPAESAAPAELPALDESDDAVSDRLVALLGRDKALSFLQLDGFVRRLVATVDNLARQRASVAVWPVNPAPQRFITQQEPDGTTTIHPDNSQRYVPMVQMVEAVDTAKAVAVYRSLYPLFQQAYEELGFPDRYFNDRVVQVLDHLIATPVQSGPLAVKLVEVKGEVPSTRPWVRYEFVDPALESLSAGRKMLLRTGPENHGRLRAKLVDIRQRVAKP
ncbi:MAG TPA: DUF3014 domain-containing protein [Hydrogenophaga sp.]|nr:DUF3014 domain-containing protein [Hydrogenophaga sp.]